MINSFVPANFDVVHCAFPYSSNDDGTPIVCKDKHPCLVVGVEEMADGAIYLSVALGTSKTHNGHSKYALQLTTRDGFALNDAGLTKETMFDLSKVAKLKYDKAFFPDIAATAAHAFKPHCRFGCLNEVARKKLRVLITDLASEGWSPRAEMYGPKDKTPKPRF